VPGFRDLLPDEAEALREAQESLLEEMRRWGYRHVVTPMVESIDVLELGLNAEQRRRLFKFSDARGEMLALVGERTIPVARLVAGKLRSTALPLRLCYAGPVLSAEEGRFHQRRVEIARALAVRPQLLLLDEPAAGLDARETEHLAELLHTVRERGNAPAPVSYTHLTLPTKA